MSVQLNLYLENLAYNIEEICEYYNLYSNMMKYWQTQLPNFIYDINYEKLVKKPKDQIKYLLKECNLDWNDNCLKFYENKRAVQTRSDIQVRQKIYKRVSISILLHPPCVTSNI